MHPIIVGRHSVGSTAYLTIIMRSGFSAPFKTCVCCIIERGISDCHLVCLYLAQGVVCPPPCCGLPMYALSRMPLLDPRRFLPTDVYVNMSMNSFWWKVRESNPLLIQGVQDVAAAVVGCRSILSVGASFPVAGLLHRFRLFPSLYRGTFF